MCLLLTVLAYYPCSLRPFRLALSHRSASSKAVEMRHFNMYLDRAPGRPAAYLNLWAYPEGGEAIPLAVPSLAAGFLLSRVVPARAAFNLIFMLDLVLSAWSFYLLARKLRHSAAGALAYAALVAFHPCVQSFILRGQLENVMLWTVGFALCALVDLLEGRHPAIAFFASLLLPAMAVFSTPYFALFLVAVWPFVLVHAVERLGLSWRAPALRRAGLSGLALLVLLPLLVQFYAPGSPSPGGMINLNPGTLELGLAGTSPTESLRDLFDPAGVLRAEKPYLGFVWLAALFAACLGCVRAAGTAEPTGGSHRTGRTGTRGMGLLLAGTVIFALLSIGRGFGPPGNRFPMPVLLLDRLVPGFENVVKMNRILPFMVMCGGLLVARYISTLPLRTSVVAAGLVCGLVAAEGIVVAPADARTRPAYYLDETEDLPEPVRALPEGELDDLPVLDLPPPVGTWAKRLWNPYTYYQTEHGQRLVWYDECPADPGGFRGRIVELCKDPARHAAGDGLGKDVVRHLRDHGIGLIVLHDLGPRETDTRPLVDLFDAAFPRLPAGGQAHVWRVAPDPGPARAAPGDR